MIGTKFGELTILDLDYEKTKTNYRHGPWMKCKCSCGTEKSIVVHHLISGHTVSCGCYGRKKSTKDLTGKKFVKLTAQYPTDKRDASGSVIWNCKCECGNEILVSSRDLLRKHVMSCGCLMSKNEEKISKLLSKYNVNYKTQYKINDLINPHTNGKLRFDFAIFDNNNHIIMFIEYDGFQHFHVCNFSRNKEAMQKRFERQQKCDYAKNEYCKNNGFSLLRIPYTYEGEIEELIIGALKEKGVI